MDTPQETMPPAPTTPPNKIRLEEWFIIVGDLANKGKNYLTDKSGMVAIKYVNWKSK